MDPFFDLLFGGDYALRQIVAGVRWPPLNAVMFFASYVNAWGLVWLLIGALATYAKPSRGRGAWQMVTAMIVAGLVAGYAIKPAVNRDRPFKVPVAQTGVTVLGDRPTDSSFPSSEVAVAVAAVVAIGRAWPAARGMLWMFAALVAVSRVYLGVHYPLDVLAGGVVGFACGRFAVGDTEWSRPPRDPYEVSAPR